MLQVILEEQTPELKPMNKPSGWVKENQADLKEFLSYVEELGHAAGLASNQVSRDGERISDRYVAVKAEGKLWLAVDPKIISTVGEPIECDEGCLTWPGKTVVAKRYPEIKVEFYTIEGEMHTRHVRNLWESQIWQHEVNHLNGVEEDVRDAGFRTVKRSKKKVGRNALCECGSKKKYKHCCMRKK